AAPSVRPNARWPATSPCPPGSRKPPRGRGSPARSTTPCACRPRLRRKRRSSSPQRAVPANRGAFGVALDGGAAGGGPASARGMVEPGVVLTEQVATVVVAVRRAHHGVDVRARRLVVAQSDAAQVVELDPHHR